MIRISEVRWKNLDGIRLENQTLKVIVLPAPGGKIVSVYDKKAQFELVSQHRQPDYRLPMYGADFSRYDASGLDDAFPNISPGEITVDGRRYCYPDHGEIWTSVFTPEIEGECVRLRYKSERFGYTYEKRLCLRENSLILDYDIRNEREEALPCIWTFHGLVNYEEDMELLYGESVQSFRNVFPGKELGDEGEVYPRKNETYNFERVPAGNSNTMVKYYADGKTGDGWCGYRYPSRRIECRYHYDSEKLPYLGTWITAGGYRGDYNCALEPSNGYYDDVQTAEKNQSLYYLKKGEPLQFRLMIEVCGF